MRKSPSAAATSNFNADRDGNVFSLTGEAESGLVNAVNEYNQKVQLTFNNLKADGNSRMTDFKERIGDQKLSLDKVAIAVEGKEMAVLEGMDVNGKSDVSKDGKSINTQLDYTLKSLKVQNQDLGTGKLSLKIGNIDGQAWHEFSQKYNAQTRQALMAQPEAAAEPGSVPAAGDGGSLQQCRTDAAERRAGDYRCAAELEKQQRRNQLQPVSVPERSGHRNG